MSKITDQGFEVYIENRKCRIGNNVDSALWPTGHENRVDFRPRNDHEDVDISYKSNLTFEGCAKLCKDNNTCHYFFYNTNKFCDLFEKCDGKFAPEDKKTKYPGFTYLKMDEGK